MDYINKIKKRVAVKKFITNKLIDKVVLDRIVDNLILAPSSLGLNAWKILIIRDADVKKTLLSSARNQPQIVTCSDLVVFLHRKNIDSNFLDKVVKINAQAKQMDAERTVNFKKMVQEYLETQNQSEIDSWLGKQVYIALGWLLSIAALEGIDSCPMEGFSKNEFDQKLNLTQTDYKSSVLCALGYRDPDHPSTNWQRARLDKVELVSFI